MHMVCAMRNLVVAFLFTLLAGLPSAIFADESGTRTPLTISATIEGQDKAIRSGLVWRLYADPTDGTPAKFVLETKDPTPTLRLPPGAYIVHAAYGLSGTTRRIVLGQSPIRETITISAGAITLKAVIGDRELPADLSHLSIYVAVGNNPEGRVLADNIRPGLPVILPAGSYRIISNYGDSNASASADIKIDSGKLIKVTLQHHAATVTLKLVNKIGGESYAGTNFSVLTPGGDTIREMTGAFPSLILAEGDYILIARNNGRVFTSEFKVKSGFDQDIEILADWSNQQPNSSPPTNGPDTSIRGSGVSAD